MIQEENRELLISSEKQKEYSKKCKSNWDSIKAYKHEKYKKIILKC